jgi:hypothetical protein
VANTGLISARARKRENKSEMGVRSGRGRKQRCYRKSRRAGMKEEEGKA